MLPRDVGVGTCCSLPTSMTVLITSVTVRCIHGAVWLERASFVSFLLLYLFIHPLCHERPSID